MRKFGDFSLGADYREGEARSVETEEKSD